MQGRVQQRRVHTERTGTLELAIREGDLREHLPIASPGTGESLKNRTVVEAGLGQPIIEILDRYRLGVERRPHTPLAGDSSPTWLL